MFSKFIQKIEIIENYISSENKRQFISGAFIAWLIGAGQKKTFVEYVKDLGLIDAPKLSKEEEKIIKEIEKQKALKNAKDIIELDKKRRNS